jgi:hypothetical protein
MNPAKILLAATSAILGCAVLVPSASVADESRSLTVTKQCNTPAQATVADELSYCTILASNFSQLVGAKVRYFGPGFFTPTHKYLDSWVVIEASQGTAFGHCLLRGVPAVLGACEFTGGSGSLRGFKADVTVTSGDFVTWQWKGAVSREDD